MVILVMVILVMVERIVAGVHGGTGGGDGCDCDTCNNGEEAIAWVDGGTGGGDGGRGCSGGDGDAGCFISVFHGFRVFVFVLICRYLFCILSVSLYISYQCLLKLLEFTCTSYECCTV